MQKPHDFRLAPFGLFLLFLLATIHTTAQEKPFVIKGRVTGADGKAISLINVDNNKKEDAYIIRDNQFLLKSKVDGLSVFALLLQDTEFPLLVASNGGDTVHIEAISDSFPSATVNGNPQALALQQYQQHFLPMIRRAKDINQQAATINPKDSVAIASLQGESDQFNQQMRQMGLAFIRQHPKSVASIFVLMNESQNMSPQAMKGLFQTLDDQVKNSRYGRMTKNNIDMTAATAIGANAPGFTLKDVDGRPVSLSTFRGKFVLVDFWASWCGPCRAENPNVVTVYDKYKDKNFTVLGVSLDNAKKNWMLAIQQDGLNWTQVSDLRGWSNEAAQLYHVSSIPSNFLLDPSGKIIAKNLRGQALEATLAQILP